MLLRFPFGINPEIAPILPGKNKGHTEHAARIAALPFHHRDPFDHGRLVVHNHIEPHGRMDAVQMMVRVQVRRHQVGILIGTG